MLPAFGTSAEQSRGFETGGGGFFPPVLPFGETLEPPFATALAPGTKSEMMINYEQASNKSIIFCFYVISIMKFI